MEERKNKKKKQKQDRNHFPAGAGTDKFGGITKFRHQRKRGRGPRQGGATLCMYFKVSETDEGFSSRGKLAIALFKGETQKREKKKYGQNIKAVIERCFKAWHNSVKASKGKAKSEKLVKV